MTETHLCPRREENPGPWKFVPETDEWLENDGKLTCSYCGSLAPEQFMEAVETGVSLVPTDKNYKAYLHIPTGETGVDQVKFYFMHLSSSQKMRLVELLNENKINFAHPGYFYVLPYFIGRGAA